MNISCFNRERHQYTPFLIKSTNVNLLSCLVCMSDKMADSPFQAKLQEFRSRRRIGWIIQDFQVSRSLTLCLETKMTWHQTPSQKKKAVMFTTVTMSTYQPLACLVGDTSFPAQSSTWLHRYYLYWTKLDNATTKFNNEMHSADNWVLNPVILHYWHNLPILILCSALLQFVLLKALYK